MKKLFIRVQGINGIILTIDPASIVGFSERGDNIKLLLISGAEVGVSESVEKIINKLNSVLGASSKD